MEIVKQDCRALQYIHSTVKNDNEICKQGITQNWKA